MASLLRCLGRASAKRLTRLEAIVLELAAVSRPNLVARLMGNEPGSSSADVSLEQLASGRWVAWGGTAVAGGATRAEALSSLGRLLDEHPTIPDEASEAGQTIAAELGFGRRSSLCARSGAIRPSRRRCPTS